MTFSLQIIWGGGTNWLLKKFVFQALSKTTGGNYLQLKATDLDTYIIKKDDDQYKIDTLYDINEILYPNSTHTLSDEYKYSSKGEFYIYLAKIAMYGNDNIKSSITHSGLTTNDDNITYNLNDYVIVASPKIKYTPNFLHIQRKANSYYYYVEDQSTSTNLEIPIYMFKPTDFCFECFNLMALKCSNYELEENLEDIDFLIKQKIIFKDNCVSYNVLLRRINKIIKRNKIIKENNDKKYKTTNCKCPYSDTIKVNYPKLLPPPDYYYPYC